MHSKNHNPNALQMTEQRKQKQRIGLLNNAPSLLNLGGGIGQAGRGLDGAGPIP